MKKLEEARRAYENTPIPEELSSRVEEGIRQGRGARQRRQRLRRRWFSAAACVMLLIAGLNVSPTVAQAAAEVPVIGGLFRVLTFVSYDKTEDDINYSVTVPEVDAESALAETVNKVIQEKVDQHLAKAQQDWEEYREAFFATGGTEEQWAGRQMDVIVDYEIKFQSDTEVSFVVTMAEGWVSSMEERTCYNLNLTENREITLKDLLGENWAEISTAAIQRQIDEEPQKYFTPEMGGFTAVDENTAFYIREDGVPVALFAEYEIAPGSTGFPEFPLA
jgi:hypothetical protein